MSRNPYGFHKIMSDKLGFNTHILIHTFTVGDASYATLWHAHKYVQFGIAMPPKADAQQIVNSMASLHHSIRTAPTALELHYNRMAP